MWVSMVVKVKGMRRNTLGEEVGGSGHTGHFEVAAIFIDPITLPERRWYTENSCAKGSSYEEEALRKHGWGVLVGVRVK